MWTCIRRIAMVVYALLKWHLRHSYILFPGTMALKSQKHFWEVPCFKRGLTCVFLMRYFLGHESQRQWHRFSVKDYKFNTRCFNRWCKFEDEILKKSKILQKLPEDFESPHSQASKRAHMSSDQLSSESPVKRRLTINDNSTDDDEA